MIVWVSKHVNATGTNPYNTNQSIREEMSHEEASGHHLHGGGDVDLAVRIARELQRIRHFEPEASVGQADRSSTADRIAELARQTRQAPHGKAQATLDNAEGKSMAPAGFRSFALRYCENQEQCDTSGKCTYITVGNYSYNL